MAVSALNKKIGSRIRELREAKNLKQCELADKLNMERSNLTRIENGKQRPSDENLIKISKILEVPLKDFFDFEHIQSKSENINQIIKILNQMTEKEVEYCYKTILNLKLIK